MAMSTNMLRPQFEDKYQCCTAVLCKWNRPRVGDLDDDGVNVSRTADSLLLCKPVRMMIKHTERNNIMLHEEMSRALYSPLSGIDVDRIKDRNLESRVIARKKLYEALSFGKKGEKCAAHEMWDADVPL